MDILIRRAALRATAKVALSLTVVGCGVVAESVEEEEAYSKGDGYADGKADDASEHDDCGDEEEELACGLTADDLGATEEVALDDDQLLCCGELLQPLVPNWEDESSWEAWQQHQTAPEVQGCCGVAIAHVDADWSKTEEIGWDTVSACCGALGNPMGPACTPWGPPVPPAIDALPLLWGMA